MANKTTIQISKELRSALSGMKGHPRESYDYLLKKLMVKRQAKMNYNPVGATKAVLGSDKKVTRRILGL